MSRAEVVTLAAGLEEQVRQASNTDSATLNSKQRSDHTEQSGSSAPTALKPGRAQRPPRAAAVPPLRLRTGSDAPTTAATTSHRSAGPGGMIVAGSGSATPATTFRLHGIPTPQEQEISMRTGHRPRISTNASTVDSTGENTAPVEIQAGSDGATSGPATAEAAGHDPPAPPKPRKRRRDPNTPMCVISDGYIFLSPGAKPPPKRTRLMAWLAERAAERQAEAERVAQAAERAAAMQARMNNVKSKLAVIRSLGGMSRNKLLGRRQSVVAYKTAEAVDVSALPEWIQGAEGQILNAENSDSDNELKRQSRAQESKRMDAAFGGSLQLSKQPRRRLSASVTTDNAALSSQTISTIQTGARERPVSKNTRLRAAEALQRQTDDLNGQASRAVAPSGFCRPRATAQPLPIGAMMSPYSADWQLLFRTVRT